MADRPARTRAEQVRLQLAAEIIAGEFRPGTRLDEVGQSSRMGVSRTPLREAVRQLASLGLVENRPHRGVVVGAGVGNALFETLAEIEAACARLATERMGAEAKAEMGRLAAKGGDWLAAIHGGCGNAVLAALAETLWQPVLVGVVHRDSMPPDTRTTLGLRITAAISSGNKAQAEARMREYVNAAAVAFVAPVGD